MKIHDSIISHKHISLPWLLSNIKDQEFVLFMSQCLSCRVKNGGRNFLELEPVHLTAKLIIPPGLCPQEEHGTFLTSF
jgi:hypothetical protein